RFNGIRFNGIRFNGIRFNGSLLNSFRRKSNSSKVVAEDPVTHEEYEASELESSEVELDTVDDSVASTDERVKIDNVVQSISQPDVYFNMVKYKKMPDNIWESMCHDGNGNPVEAIALRSTWNSTTGVDLDDSDGLTWACRGAALAKCVEWGYRRWSTHGGTSLKNYHKACTRMVRGDYCGAGVPHTSNGTPIDIADDLGINNHDAIAGVGGWEIEAKWGPNGAVCLNNPRKTSWTHANVGCSIPYCNNDQDDYEGALLMSVTQQTN
ncbi:MAG: ADYC domain-containing protein, partial [Nannocystaceae bacterium]